ncbi:MAG: rod shape-determining protein MreC [Eubacteriales bacterium]|nr:rod shape-determining protein MreC [Eubacteriales bacterium]
MSIFRKNKKETKSDSSLFRRFFARLRPYARLVVIIVSYVVFTAIIAVMMLARIQNWDSFRFAENSIATVVSPIQNGFQGFVNNIADQLRKIKLRNNIEKEYNRLLAENEQLVYEAMRANELQIQLSQYKSIADEITLNAALNPITANVIGKTPGNYFSVFTINKGTAHGLENFMAVTSNGALIGYTYNVSLNKADVRTIIDSEASIAALIQTSRDQGTIRGSLNIDGRPLCRMYYLPDENLPRPGDEVVTSGVGMSFPRGIPIGTVRESTRGLAENKLYIVVEPKNDFRHIENVIVLRYKPEAIAVSLDKINDEDVIYDPLPSMVPVPTIYLGKDAVMLEPSPSPEPSGQAEDLIEIEETPDPTPAQESTPAPLDPAGEYQVPDASEEPELLFTLKPTATPSPTPVPLEVVVEDD